MFLKWQLNCFVLHKKTASRRSGYYYLSNKIEGSKRVIVLQRKIIYRTVSNSRIYELWNFKFKGMEFFFIMACSSRPLHSLWYYVVVKGPKRFFLGFVVGNCLATVPVGLRRHKIIAVISSFSRTVLYIKYKVNLLMHTRPQSYLHIIK